MPVSKSLKKLQKRKVDTSLHPRSLKYKQFTTAELRQSKLDKVKSQRKDAQEMRLERFKFVQAICQNVQKELYTTEEMRTMCQEFIDRNKPELEKLEKERRPGRPPSNKYLQLKNAMDQENKEFQSGFSIADLTDPATVKNLLAWNGSWGGLNTLKLISLMKD